MRKSRLIQVEKLGRVLLEQESASRPPPFCSKGCRRGRYDGLDVIDSRSAHDAIDNGDKDSTLSAT